MPSQQHQSFFGAEIPKETIEQATEISKLAAQNYLNVIEMNASESSVLYEVICIVNDRPYEAIVRVAEQRNCDLIMMASHGRSGVKALLIGSETQKVLTHSTIPVFVYR